MSERKLSLSDAVARDLPVPEKGSPIYWDTKTAYFGLRVNPGGTKQWVVQRKLGRRAIKVTLGVFFKPGDVRVRRMTYTEARKAAAEVAAAIQAGRDPNLEHRQQLRKVEQERADETHTVTRCMEMYIEKCRNGAEPCKPNTITGYEKAKARLEAGTLGSIPLVELTGQHLLDYYATACRKTKGTKTAKRGGRTQTSGDLRALRAAYASAVKKLQLKDLENPFLLLNSEVPGWFKTKPRQVIVATATGQLAKWWAAVEAIRARVDDAGLSDHDKKRRLQSAAIADFLLLAVLWGMRRVELLQLRWSYINEEWGYVRVPGLASEWGQGTKNHKDNVKPLTRWVRELLDRRRRDNELYAPGSGWLFPSLRTNKAGKQWHIAEPKGVIAKVREASKVDFAPQDLRRTFGSLFVELEAGSDTVRVALSHSADDTASAHYIISRLEPYRAICQKYEDKVLLEAGVLTLPAKDVTLTPDDYMDFLAWQASKQRQQV
ncbi:tyrosine-type recombinase/integrase [Quatrionicoccus australiensis]|uniref:tyrosine-type recombinase/integrase n=1 Tax=Quatrionicoccus australiensis TaxID=138118 RepID=UPI001CFBEF11|nr:tyrosine-type recombinase/integrase [Quatrionicoccus australiensis]MCB4359609.1 tyrosine-type recombinase/integrase [Quatrionicoccus australiensis]